MGRSADLPIPLYGFVKGLMPFRAEGACQSILYCTFSVTGTRWVNCNSPSSP